MVTTPSARYSIDEIAQMTNLTPRTLRVYEETGLLPPRDGRRKARGMSVTTTPPASGYPARPEAPQQEAHGLPAQGFHALTRQQTIGTLVALMLTLLLAALDQTIVGTAMPRIIAQLNG